MEESSTNFGGATVTWRINQDSPKITTVYKRMRSIVKLMDQVTTYEELYNALKLLRPKDYYKIVSVSLEKDSMAFHLTIFEDEEENNVE